MQRRRAPTIRVPSPGRPRKRDERAQGQREGGDDGIGEASDSSRFPRSRSVHQWACGLRANANEKSVAAASSGKSVTASGGQAEPRGRRARRARRSASAHSVTSKRDERVVGIDGAQRRAAARTRSVPRW